MFYRSVIHGLGFFVCFILYILNAQTNKIRLFYVLHSDEKWVIDKSERAQCPIVDRFRKQSKESKRADWLKMVFVSPDGDTELVRAVDVVMTRTKRIYILIIKVNKLFSFFSSRCFIKEIENMYSVFLSSYTITSESLGELEKAVETLACGSCSHSISQTPSTRVCITR